MSPRASVPPSEGGTDRDRHAAAGGTDPCGVHSRGVDRDVSQANEEVAGRAHEDEQYRHGEERHDHRSAIATTDTVRRMSSADAEGDGGALPVAPGQVVQKHV